MNKKYPHSGYVWMVQSSVEINAVWIIKLNYEINAVSMPPLPV